MAVFRVLHCADLHLNSPFLGLSKIDSEASQYLRDATFASFRHIIDQAISKRVDLVTVAGDIYDSSDHGLHTAVVFRDELRRLSRAGIPCCVVAGNHDPLSSWRLAAKLPEGCHLFDDIVGCQTIKRGDEVVACVYGVSFPTSAVRKNLAQQIMDAHQAGPGLHLALLHCNLGSNTGHENYAPCTLEELRRGPFEAWLLGHVHERQTVSDADPLVLYPGNTQGRSIREIGERGAALITFTGSGAPDIEFVPTATVVWLRGQTKIEKLVELEELVERIDDDIENLITEHPDKSAFVVRWSLVGRGALHKQLTVQLEELVETLRERFRQSSPVVWIEKLERATQPPLDLDELRQQKGFISMVLSCGDEFASAPTPSEELLERFSDLWASPKLKRPLGGLRQRLQDDPAFFKRLVQSANMLAVGALSEGGGK